MGNPALALAIFGGLATACVALHLAGERWIDRVSRPLVLDSLDGAIGTTRIVVLGCPPRTRTGKPNPLLTARVAAAAAAYHRVDGARVVCSGRLDPSGFHEAEELGRGLRAANVPEHAIDLDRNARRTIDTITYLRDRDPDAPTLVVTQAFHLGRALFLASRAGLDVHGLPAAGAAPAPRVRLRETFARSRAVLDSLLRRGPVVSPRD